MADLELDALVYATFDHQPTVIADDVLTNPKTEDAYGVGTNRRLSPVIGFPAITVPAGFTVDGLPVGLELLGRPFTEGMLLQYAYAFEQRTKHRRPPGTTSALSARDGEVFKGKGLWTRVSAAAVSMWGTRNEERPAGPGLATGTELLPRVIPSVSFRL
jgi:hypothetical protein